MKNGSTSPKVVSIDEGFKLSLIVTVTVKTRQVKVSGPKGEITKNFKHMPVEMKI